LSTYAKIYAWKPSLLNVRPTALIDRWILSLTQKLIQDVEAAMDRYDLNSAVEPFVKFVDQLTNWYIRRCRSRFWADQDTQDRREAFSTLYGVLLDVIKIAAPFIPFLTEAIYEQLRSIDSPESVHLCDYPEYLDKWRDIELESEVEAAQAAVSLGHSLRKEYKMKVRQPLAKAHLITSNKSLLHSLEKQKQLIADELNVKTIEFHSEEGQFVQWQVKPNFPVLGKKIGRLMPEAQKVIQGLSHQQMQTLNQGSSVSISLGGHPLELEPADVQIERKVKEGLAAGNLGELTVALDLSMTDDLLLEGLARELMNKINAMRRDMGLEVTDRIRIRLQTTPRVEQALILYGKTIEAEVLAVDIQLTSCEGILWDLNGEEARLILEKA
ncbi:MAG: class I tRNA ligase family protein, partial [Chlamydiales bacterium]|nr:class I tRNA ligase family protein [Chlamydiales bacterium]